MGRLGIPPPSHLCTGSMEFLRYCGLVVRTAFSPALDYAQAVVFALVIAAGLLTYLTFDGSVDARAWQLVAAVVGVGIAFRLAFATYGLWKEQCVRADAVEQKLSELDSTKVERRAKLREFYSSVEVIMGRTVARDISPEEFREYLTEMEGWVASTATWIAENMGEAALSRFLDRSAGFAGFYRGALNEEHNRAVSLLNLYRTNLRSLIESDVWT
jgi:hypothetical protein